MKLTHLAYLVGHKRRDTALTWSTSDVEIVVGGRVSGRVASCPRHRRCAAPSIACVRRRVNSAIIFDENKCVTCVDRVSEGGRRCKSTVAGERHVLAIVRCNWETYMTFAWSVERSELL